MLDHTFCITAWMEDQVFNCGGPTFIFPTLERVLSLIRYDWMGDSNRVKWIPRFKCHRGILMADFRAAVAKLRPEEKQEFWAAIQSGQYNEPEFVREDVTDVVDTTPIDAVEYLCQATALDDISDRNATVLVDRLDPHSDDRQEIPMKMETLTAAQEAVVSNLSDTSLLNIYHYLLNDVANSDDVPDEDILFHAAVVDGLKERSLL